MATWQEVRGKLLDWAKANPDSKLALKFFKLNKYPATGDYLTNEEIDEYRDQLPNIAAHFFRWKDAKKNKIVAIPNSEDWDWHKKGYKPFLGPRYAGGVGPNYTSIPGQWQKYQPDPSAPARNSFSVLRLRSPKSYSLLQALQGPKYKAYIIGTKGDKTAEAKEAGWGGDGDAELLKEEIIPLESVDIPESNPLSYEDIPEETYAKPNKLSALMNGLELEKKYGHKGEKYINELLPQYHQKIKELKQKGATDKDPSVVLLKARTDMSDTLTNVVPEAKKSAFRFLRAEGYKPEEIQKAIDEYKNMLDITTKAEDGIEQPIIDWKKAYNKPGANYTNNTFRNLTDKYNTEITNMIQANDPLKKWITELENDEEFKDILDSDRRMKNITSAVRTKY
jgi:hypothetical protein